MNTNKTVVVFMGIKHAHGTISPLLKLHMGAVYQN